MFKMRDVFRQPRQPGKPLPAYPPDVQVAPGNEESPLEPEPDADFDDTFGGSLGRENEMNGRGSRPRKLF